MSEFEKLSVFWNESAIYLLVYGVYALLVCAAVFFIESRLRKIAGTALSRLALHNLLLASIAIVLFALSLLVSGWYANWLGGEPGAFAVCVATAVLVSYFLKSRSIQRLSLGYRSAGTAAGLVAAVLAAPYAFGALFIFLLAAGLRN